MCGDVIVQVKQAIFTNYLTQKEMVNLAQFYKMHFPLIQ